MKHVSGEHITHTHTHVHGTHFSYFWSHLKLFIGIGNRIKTVVTTYQTNNVIITTESCMVCIFVYTVQRMILYIYNFMDCAIKRRDTDALERERVR